MGAAIVPEYAIAGLGNHKVFWYGAETKRYKILS